jgi:hypothetical protein
LPAQAPRKCGGTSDGEEGSVSDGAKLDIPWYADPKAEKRGEPGIHHSFMKCLATALHHVAGKLDPVWLMGSSASAFRITVSETFCPSAMSMFDFSAVLPEAIEQAGYEAVHIGRYWKEEALEKERREEAHTAIVTGIDRGVPAVVWDVYDTEWGLVTGYEPSRELYRTLSHQGMKAELPYARLGCNEIAILSVSIPGPRNRRSRHQVIRNSLRAIESLLAS